MLVMNEDLQRAWLKFMADFDNKQIFSLADMNKSFEAGFCEASKKVNMPRSPEDHIDHAIGEE